VRRAARENYPPGCGRFGVALEKFFMRGIAKYLLAAVSDAILLTRFGHLLQRLL
jgi:hypothetical protein